VNVPWRKWPWFVGGAVLVIVVIGVVHNRDRGLAVIAPAATSQAHPSAVARPNMVTRQPARPTGPVTSFGDGNYRVGAAAGDVSPGRYSSTGPTEGMPCYWARTQDPAGKADGVIADGYPPGPTTVTIENADGAFVVSGCGQWSKVG
jgi:hypothetical protein